MQDDVLFERRGAAAWITLNRPAVRNALSRDLNLRLQEIARDLEPDDAVRAVVITGAGGHASAPAPTSRSGVACPRPRPARTSTRSRARSTASASSASRRSRR